MTNTWLAVESNRLKEMGPLLGVGSLLGCPVTPPHAARSEIAPTETTAAAVNRLGVSAPICYLPLGEHQNAVTCVGTTDGAATRCECASTCRSLIGWIVVCKSIRDPRVTTGHPTGRSAVKIVAPGGGGGSYGYYYESVWPRSGR